VHVIGRKTPRSKDTKDTIIIKSISPLSAEQDVVGQKQGWCDGSVNRRAAGDRNNATEG
jgi:hypothetical protein